MPLCDLFNYSLSSGQFHEAWMQANITPMHKKEDPSDPSNYHPISLLCAVGKVLEKVVHKYVFNFCRDNAIISSLQSGFVAEDSTVNQLVDIYNTFCKALDEGKEVRAVFCDVSKAVDRVWYKGLLYKLNRAGISGTLLSWFTNYLSNRKQRVVLPGTSLSWKPIKAVVPQGSILGPLLFLILFQRYGWRCSVLHTSFRWRYQSLYNCWRPYWGSTNAIFWFGKDQPVDEKVACTFQSSKIRISTFLTKNKQTIPSSFYHE